MFLEYYYLAIYCIFFICLILLSAEIREIPERYFFIPTIILLIIIYLSKDLNLDNSIGNDFITYYGYYNLAGGRTFFEYIGYLPSVERFFLTYNFILYSIFGSMSPKSYLFFSIIPTLAFGSFALFRLAPNGSKILVLVLCLSAPVSIFIASQLIRQTISFMIIFYAITCHSDKKRIILFVFAFFTHKLSILLIFIYYLYNNVYGLLAARTKIIFILGTPIICLILSNLIDQDFDNFIITLQVYSSIADKGAYLLDESRTGGTFNWGFFFIFYSLTLFLSGILLALKKNYSKNLEVFFLMIFFIFNLLVLFSSVHAINERFATYVNLFYPLFVVYLLQWFTGWTKYLLRCLLVLYSLIIFTNVAMNMNDGGIFDNTFVLKACSGTLILAT